MSVKFDVLFCSVLPFSSLLEIQIPCFVLSVWLWFHLYFSFPNYWFSSSFLFLSICHYFYSVFLLNLYYSLFSRSVLILCPLFNYCFSSSFILHLFVLFSFNFLFLYFVLIPMITYASAMIVWYIFCFEVSSWYVSFYKVQGTAK
jgi:hypothetical protein